MNHQDRPRPAASDAVDPDAVDPAGRDRARRPGVRVLRLVLAAVGLAGVLGSLLPQLDDPGYSVGNFFSYFTIQSNLLLVSVLVAGAVALPRATWWDALRGAAVLFMLITGIVYAVLLADVAVGLTAAWTNAVVHQLMPVVALLDLLLVPVRRRIPWRTGLLWLLYPAGYAVYSLLRGPVVDWYPYPFLDPTGEGGYGAVGRTALVLALFMAALALAVVALSRAVRRWSGVGSGQIDPGPGTRHHPE